MSDLKDLMLKAEADVAAASDLAALDAVRVAYLGKKGALTAQMKTLGSLSASERPAAGQAINQAKQTLKSALDARREALNQEQLERKLAADAVDVTLPARGGSRGGRHPVSRAMLRIERSFAKRVSACARGPRSKTITTTSPRSISPKTTPHGRCTTRSTSRAGGC